MTEGIENWKKEVNDFGRGREGQLDAMAFCFALDGCGGQNSSEEYNRRAFIHEKAFLTRIVRARVCA